jgi:hypothetical protein
MMIGNILDFWSSVRERCLESVFKTSLGLRPTAAVSGGAAGCCDPVSPAKAAALAIKISNENPRFIRFSQCRSRCVNHDESDPGMSVFLRNLTKGRLDIF